MPPLYLLFTIIIELILIFLLSRNIFSLLYTLFFLPTKHHTIAHTIATLLFLPGTIIHEFSHAVIARLMGVKIGQIRVYPFRDKETGELKAGNCEIEKVDPVRLTIIGIAPTILGILILYLIVLYIFNKSLPSTDFILIIKTLLNLKNWPAYLGIFFISSTMFTSKKDLKEAAIVFPVLILFGFILYTMGGRIPLISLFEKPLNSLSIVLGITLVVDVVIFTFLFIPVSLILSLIRR